MKNHCPYLLPYKNKSPLSSIGINGIAIVNNFKNNEYKNHLADAVPHHTLCNLCTERNCFN
jgi:hypothetical protein